MTSVDRAAGSVRRVGVFGGAFDPPHLAHRALAEAALSELALDRLHIIPTGRAGHKTRPLTDPAHRLALCERAFAGLDGCRLDARELTRDGVSYTIDTLEALASEYPGAQLFLVIGDDQLAAFKTWRRWDEVLTLATLAVASRALPAGGGSVAGGGLSAPLLSPDVPFVRLKTPYLDISATEVRARVAAGADDPAGLTKLVPEAVASYISQHSLYQKPS